MNEFIHTLSATAHLFLAEKNDLEKAYREDFFYHKEKQKFILSKYIENGLRIEIAFNHKKEKQYDKKHRDCKIELIINPAKLCYPGETMRKLLSADEYRQAMDNLEILLGEIELRSGVNLWKEVKIKRIDLAKDIQTPSDAYSQEVIRLAKKALWKTGYHIWTPTETDIEKTGWAEENSILFRNHNQGVNAKIYNKLEDMRSNNLDSGGLSGLLRFELSLKKDYINERFSGARKHIDLFELSDLLVNVLENAPSLMQSYLTDPLWSGALLSKDLQKTYMKIQCRGKKERYKKMLAYRWKCNRDGERIDRSERILEAFSAMGLSPIYTSEEFRYVPSFEELLNERRDEGMERFLKLHEKAV